MAGMSPRVLLPLLCLTLLAAVAPATASAAVSAQTPPPACTEEAANAALDATTILDAPLGRWWSRGGDDEPFDLMTTFTLEKVLCRDLTGDGVQEMTAYLACCTVTSPRPVVIFEARDGAWTAVHALSGLGRRAIWNLKVVGRELRFRSPIYRRSDANCCPSGGYRKYRVVYADGRYRLRRG